MDQVGEQRDAARGEEDDGLERGREARTPSASATARSPARERRIEWWTRPCEWPCAWAPIAYAAFLPRGVPAGEPEPHVLDVPEHLLEQLGDVVVVELVDDAAAGALADDQAEVAQHAQLVRDRRRVHPDGGRDLGDRRRAVVQAGEDPQPAGRGERLEAVGGGARVGLVVEQAGDVGGVAVAHAADDT